MQEEWRKGGDEAVTWRRVILTVTIVLSVFFCHQFNQIRSCFFQLPRFK